MIMLHLQDEKLKQRGVKRKEKKNRKHCTKYTQELTVTSNNEYLGGIKVFNSQDNSNLLGSQLWQSFAQKMICEEEMAIFPKSSRIDLKLSF